MSEVGPHDPTQNLSLFDRLALAIGRVALADVELERSLRTLAVVISLDGVVRGVRGTVQWKIPRDAAALIDYCEQWLSGRVSDERLVESGRSTLAEARAAHEERNRVVHDQWIPETVDGVVVTDTFSTQRFEKNRALPVSVSTRTIHDIYAVKVGLRQTAVRVDFLAYAITLLDTKVTNGCGA